MYITPTDASHIEYCKREHDGYCPFRHVKCDGLCNNCGLNAPSIMNAKSTANGFCKPEIVFNTELLMDEPI